mmetsp:Transcript_32622/g.61319  ORF Transcript_32622/g.61319 Transcript_32622/m.61319 type:complete len:211 (-) Transcript_32622:1754-2386(-)
MHARRNRSAGVRHRLGNVLRENRVPHQPGGRTWELRAAAATHHARNHVHGSGAGGHHLLLPHSQRRTVPRRHRLLRGAARGLHPHRHARRVHHHHGPRLPRARGGEGDCDPALGGGGPGSHDSAVLGQDWHAHPQQDEVAEGDAALRGGCVQERRAGGRGARHQMARAPQGRSRHAGAERHRLEAPGHVRAAGARAVRHQHQAHGSHPAT